MGRVAAFLALACLLAACGRGLTVNGNRAAEGYVLFAPLLSTTTYLIDRDGRLVHTWQSRYPPGVSVRLLENGHLLRCSRQPDAPFRAAGQGGRIQEFTWEGQLVWEWVVASRERLQHHDIEPLPNGNILLIVWEPKTHEQAMRAGRRRAGAGPQGLWPDAVLEVQPQRPSGGRIVWEWHSWDHRIQDRDPRAENYGPVREHPELIDINGDSEHEPVTDQELDRFKSIGYISGDAEVADLDPDFMHTNSVAYNARLDQIALSVNNFNEIWIIDHGTTTAQAAGHSGGRAGRGGDLLYRWGNPRAYRRGLSGDRQFFGQHDVRWIPAGSPGAGRLMAFNNGSGRKGRDYSSVVEWELPLNADGTYRMEPGRPFGPKTPAWTYPHPGRPSIYADFISSAHRLANGNTFICLGPQGRFLEVTAAGETVWQYDNPYSGDAPNPFGDPARSVFRATKIPPDHPGLRGHALKPLLASLPLCGEL